MKAAHRFFYGLLVGTGAASMFWSLIEGQLTDGHRESIITAGLVAAIANALRRDRDGAA